jgi:hypothetical protein
MSAYKVHMAFGPQFHGDCYSDKEEAEVRGIGTCSIPESSVVNFKHVCNNQKTVTVANLSSATDISFMNLMENRWIVSPPKYYSIHVLGIRIKSSIILPREHHSTVIVLCIFTWLQSSISW